MGVTKKVFKPGALTWSKGACVLSHIISSLLSGDQKFLRAGPSTVISFWTSLLSSTPTIPFTESFSKILAKSHKGWQELTLRWYFTPSEPILETSSLVGVGVGLLRGLSKHPVYTFWVKQHFSFLNIFFWLRRLAESWKDNGEIRFWHQYPNKLWEFRGKPNSS